MRIGIDASCWANGRGYGRFVRELFAEMVRIAPDDEFICFLDRASDLVFDVSAPNVHRVLVDQAVAPTVAAVTGSSRSPADMIRLTRAVHRERLDLMFSPSVYTYFPLPPGLPALVGIHDAIAERFPERTLPSFRDRLFWKLKVALAIWQSRLVLTVSDYAKAELVRELGLSPDRIRVATEAPSASFTPEEDKTLISSAARRVGIPEGAPWFTYVGGFNPHKNLPMLLRCFGRLIDGTTQPPPHLVLVGSRESDGFHSEVGAIESAIAAQSLEDRVHWTGYLPDPDLRVLLSGSSALLLVSDSEGFGLPAVEAAACGCPVVATTESPLPQLLQGGGWFVDPSDPEATFNAMQAVLLDPTEARRRGAIALGRARRLSWESAAGRTMDALREVAAPASK